jgi:Zinc carboxypeptidase
MPGRKFRWAQRVCAGLGLLALAACSSPTPQPAPAVFSPVGPTGIRPPEPPAPVSAAPASASAPARPVLTPLPPVLSGPPVPPAIAARFPEPALSFATPAFEPGRSAYTTNDELRSILRGLQQSGADPGHGTDVAVLPLGVSQSGLPIDALAFTRAPAAAPLAAAAAASGASAPLAAASPPAPPAHRPAVLLIAGQHGDEPAGSEALIVIAQDLAAGRLDRVLDQVDVYLLPRANPDGAVLGQRASADGSDVNRDHLLLRTPEAQAMAQLVRDVAPVVVLDLHEYAVDAGFAAKFGGVQRFDALLDTATVANLRPFVARAAEEWFRAPLATSLAAASFSTEWYYTLAADPADRQVSMGSVGPQVGRNAQGLKNAVSLLVETRGGGIGRTDLKRRVAVATTAVRSVLGNAATHAGDLVKLRQFVERDIAAGACQGEAVIEATTTPSEHTLTMLDPATGAIKRVTVAWESALELRVLKSRPRPCGYWLAASESDAVRRLRRLGIEVQQVDEEGEVRGETYREIGREAIAGGAEASVAARLRVQTAPVLLDVAAGSYYVSLEQPLANLAIAALEPESPAGYAANGVVGNVTSLARVLDRPRMRMRMVGLP